jgi:flagellar biosynthesis/type III secretory pathway protein FliH
LVTAGALPSPASADPAQDRADAENASEPMPGDAATAALPQAELQSASHRDSGGNAGDTDDAATLDAVADADVEADAAHGANKVEPGNAGNTDDNDGEDRAGSDGNVNAASAVLSPAETASKAATVPAGHRLVSEQVLAGAMARERAMGRQQGMAEGRAAASASAEEEVQQLRAVLQGLRASLTDTQRLFEPMQRLALHLAEQLVRGELEFSSRAIRRLIESALLEVDQKLAFSVRLNPEDLQLLRTALGEDDAMHMAGDPALSRGSVRVEMDDGVVEDLIEHRLDTLARSLLGPEVKPHASVLSRSNLHPPANALPVQHVNASHAVSHAAVHTPGVEPGLARQDWTPPFARHEVSDIEPVAAVEPVHGYPYGD